MTQKQLMDYDDKLRHILTRHEQGAAHAAQAYAMVTGKPGENERIGRGSGGTSVVKSTRLSAARAVPVLAV